MESVFSTVAISHNVQQLSLNEWRLLKIVLRNMTALSFLAYALFQLILIFPCVSTMNGTKICFYSVTDFFCSNAVVLRVYKRGHVLIWKCLGDSVSPR